MNKNILRLRQNYPLWMKIAITKRRIQQWVDYYGEDMVYVSFSGGKDSTVLLHIVRSMYPNIKAVFSSTGNEYPEIVLFVRSVDNVTWVRPDKTFKQILKDEGYPVGSKMVSRMLRDLKNPTPRNENVRRLNLTGYTKNGTYCPSKKLPKKWYGLIDSPFPISEKCCDELKKKPLKSFEKANKTKKIKKYDEVYKPMPIIGTQASESQNREEQYLKRGCNGFNSKEPKSTPLGFWTEQDILEYIVTHDLEIASIYGEIKQDKDGKYYTTGESRTGCVACGYGVHLEGNTDNRYLRLEQTHPKLHKHVIVNLGFGDVLDYMNIRYTKLDFKNIV